MQATDRDATTQASGRVVLVGSSGGHLAQLYRLGPWWRHRERTWVTFDTPDAVSLLDGEEDVVWAHRPTTRNIPNLLRNTVLAWRLLRRSRPAMILSTGAGVAFPFFLLGRLLGIKTVYIEVYDRIDSRTLTGRLCEPLSDLFLLQWEDQQALYPRGVVVGRLL
jgi:UDP-N-acetylglucosamine:LPS N-acetylglucosamine transferase